MEATISKKHRVTQNWPRIETLKIEDISLSGDTQSRIDVDQDLVKEYADLMVDGVKFPPVSVMFDGEQYWLYDGFHRRWAAVQAKLVELECSVSEGTLLDARWASYGANKANGLRLTSEEKKNAVLKALKHPNGADKSNCYIARHVGVTDKTVAKYRAKLEATSEIPKSESRSGSDGRTINVAAIGKADQREESPVLNATTPGKSVAEIAEMVGVTPAMVDKATVILNSGNEGLIKACERGEIELDEAIEQITPSITLPKVTASKKGTLKWRDAPHGYCSAGNGLEAHQWDGEACKLCHEPAPKDEGERLLCEMSNPEILLRDRINLMIGVLGRDAIDESFYAELRRRFTDDFQATLNDQITADAVPFLLNMQHDLGQVRRSQEILRAIGETLAKFGM